MNILFSQGHGPRAFHFEGEIPIYSDIYRQNEDIIMTKER
jgi:hypothetical protein